jgi:putative tryptophan/tyrosine transport system permease protein
MMETFLNLVPITLAQSLIYAFPALAIMIPFRTLALPDLTAEGSLPLGGCVAAALLTSGLDPWSSTALALIGGSAAGALAAVIHLYLKVPSLLAGVLVTTLIWSVDLRTMGMPNMAVPPELSLFDAISPAILLDVRLQTALMAAIVGAILVALIIFFQTEVGLSMRCVGSNARLAPALGISTRFYVIVGFSLANAMAAFGGALVVQSQGYADVTMGFGVLVNALAALIIGEAIIGRGRIERQLAAPVVGALIYYQLVSLGLATGLHPSDLKFVTATFVLITLAVPLITGRSKSIVGA